MCTEEISEIIAAKITEILQKQDTNFTCSETVIYNPRFEDISYGIWYWETDGDFIIIGTKDNSTQFKLASPRCFHDAADLIAVDILKGK